MCAASADAQASWPSTASGTNNVVGTCDLGWTGAPTRSCGLTGSWSTVSGSCTRMSCSATDDAGAQASWASSFAGTSNVAGSCHPNTSGAPSRDCFYNATWSAVVNPCITNPCVALPSDNNANWPSPPAVNMIVQGNCLSGYSSPSQPSRLCQSNGQWSSTISNPCVRNVCSGVSEDNASWPSANSLTTASGTCVPGYTGSPTRPCSAAGTYGAISNRCTQIFCPAAEEDSATWASSAAGSNGVQGSCVPGYAGSPTRNCGITGSWTAIVSPCVQLWCPALNDSSAQALWGTTAAGSSSVSGQCYDNTSGSPTRTCQFDGTWGPSINPCSTNPCTARTNDHHADWSSPMFVDTVVTGSCVAGWTAGSLTPKRLCQSDGRWSETITEPCERNMCAAVTESFSTWTETGSLDTVSGTCVAGYEGSPSRTCQADGTFGTISNPCTRT